MSRPPISGAVGDGSTPSESEEQTMMLIVGVLAVVGLAFFLVKSRQQTAKSR